MTDTEYLLLCNSVICETERLVMMLLVESCVGEPGCGGTGTGRSIAGSSVIGANA